MGQLSQPRDRPTDVKRTAAALLAFAVLACGREPSRPQADPSTSSPPASTSPNAKAVDFCVELASLTDQLLACLSPDEFLYESYRKTGELARMDRSDPQVAASLESSCAGYLEAFTRSPAEYPPPCKIQPLSATVRAQLEALHGRRTVIPTTGDPVVDEDARWWMTQRDRVCACKDFACSEAAQQELEANVPKAPPNRPASITEAESRVYDELMRCHSQLRQKAVQQMIDAERDAGVSP